MDARRIYGGLNVEFEGKKFVNFAILDRACDECLSREGGCEGCEEVEKPWNEYYTFLEYDFCGNCEEEKETDINKAIRKLIRILQSYVDSKE